MCMDHARPCIFAFTGCIRSAMPLMTVCFCMSLFMLRSWCAGLHCGSFQHRQRADQIVQPWRRRCQLFHSWAVHPTWTFCRLLPAKDRHRGGTRSCRLSIAVVPADSDAVGPRADLGVRTSSGLLCELKQAHFGVSSLCDVPRLPDVCKRLCQAVWRPT